MTKLGDFFFGKSYKFYILYVWIYMLNTNIKQLLTDCRSSNGHACALPQWTQGSLTIPTQQLFCIQNSCKQFLFYPLESVAMFSCFFQSQFLLSPLEYSPMLSYNVSSAYACLIFTPWGHLSVNLIRFGLATEWKILLS